MKGMMTVMAWLGGVLALAHGCAEPEQVQQHHRRYVFHVAAPAVLRAPLIQNVQALFDQINTYVGAEHFAILGPGEMAQYDPSALSLSLLEVKDITRYKDPMVMGYAYSRRKSMHHKNNGRETTLVLHSMHIVIDQDWLAQIFRQGQEGQPLFRLQNLMLHELGHGLGFKHSGHAEGVMYHEISAESKNLMPFFERIKQSVL